MIEGDNYPPSSWKWTLAQFFVSEFSINYLYTVNNKSSPKWRLYGAKHDTKT